MAFTKIRGPAGITTTDNYRVGVITATKFVGPFDGVVIGGDGINVSGIVTATGLDINGNADISGNLTVHGDSTTLNTTLREVELLHVDANASVTAGIITQRGSGDILNLFDTTTEVFTVLDGGKVGINQAAPEALLHIEASSSGASYTADAADTLILERNGGCVIDFRTPAANDGGLVFSDNAARAQGTLLYNHSDNHLQIGTAGAERLRILSDGKLLLGATSASNAENFRIHTASSDKAIMKFTNTGTGSGAGDGLEFGLNSNEDAELVLKEDKNILFFTGATTTEKLRITSAGSVGINSTSPDRRFTLQQDATCRMNLKSLANSTAGIEFGDEADHNAGYIVYDNTDNSFQVGVNGTGEKVRITSDGVLKLTGQTTVRETAGLTHHTNGNLYIRGGATGAILQSVDENEAIVVQNTYITAVTNGAERIRIDANGNSNFGLEKAVAFPSGTGIQVYHSANPRIKLANDNTGFSGTDGTQIYLSSDGDTIIDNKDSEDIIFHTNASEKLRIRSDGRIGVAIAAAVAQFQVNSTKNAETDRHDATNYHLALRNPADDNGEAIGLSFGITSNTTKVGAAILHERDGGGSTGSLQFYTSPDGNGVTERLRITSGGNLKLPDSAKIEFGGAQTGGGDLYIQHDPTGSGSDTIDSSAGYMYINSDALRLNSKTSAWNYLRGDKSDGVVKLYKSNSQKLATSDTGITVTGEVAASQDYPNFRPTLDFNFAAVKKLDSIIEYRRTGPASYIDDLGFVKLVGPNVPRFDHDPATKESKGLLIEEIRTNLLPYSLDDGRWVAQSGGTLTRDAGTAPDGTETAVKAVISSNDIDVSPKVSGTDNTANITVSSSTAYTLSVWAKASTTAQVGNNFKVRMKRVSGDSFGVETTFALTENWTRHSVTGTTPANVTQVMCYVGGVSGSEALVWGAQLEAGSYATSLIPTSGASAARGADIVTIEGEEFTDFYNNEEGTLVLSASYTEDIRTSAAVIIDDTSNESEYTEIGYRAGGGSSGSVGSYIRTDSGNDQYFKAYSSSATAGSEFKVALAYKNNDYASSANGQTVHTDTSGTTSRLYDRLRFSDVDTVGVAGAGHYRRFIYYSKRLTNNQVVTLTS